MIDVSIVPSADFAIDLATLSLIIGLLHLCFLSLCLIFYLQFKTEDSLHLKKFNALWTVRILLAFFIILWALNETLRLPFFRKPYIYPFYENITLTEQATLCKAHVAVSLGFLEPGFLTILLFLLHASIKTKTPRWSWAIAFLLAICLPLSLLQILFVFGWRLEPNLPSWLVRSSEYFDDGTASNIVLCSYPLVSVALFGAFAVVYGLYFLFSCWNVASLVINKKLRVRTHALAITVLTTITLQVLLLVLSIFWNPEKRAYEVVAFLSFLCTFVCAVVGQFILVIIPIIDSLAVGGHTCQVYPTIPSQLFEEESREDSV